MLRQGCRIVMVGWAALLSGCSGSSSPPPIFLGHVATLSGADAKAGKSAEQGIRLALEELGAAASANLQGRPLVVRHVDAAGSLDNMEAQAARLVSVNKAVGLLGGVTKDEALRLDRSRVPILSAVGFRTSAMSELLFTTGLAPATQGQVLAQFLAEEAPAAGALIVDPRREESLVFGEHFRRAWVDAVGKKDAKTELPRWTEVALPKDAKLAEWAAGILAPKPATIVFAGAAADFETLRRAWGAAAPRLVFAGDDGSWTDGKAVAGQTVYVATAFALGKEETKALEFAKKYRAANRAEPDVQAVIAYDNVRLFAEALAKGQSSAPDKLREELLKLQDFPGVTGPLTFTRDQQLRRTIFVARVDGAARIPMAVKSYNP
jgi:branched-chain amino acid transport system substrate-binding protein